MTVFDLFVPIVVGMVIVATLFLVVPLWRVWRLDLRNDGDSLNRSVLVDQIRELQADLDGGLLDATTYAEARHDIDQQANETAASVGAGHVRHYWILIGALVVIVPLAAVGLYRIVGSPLLAMHPQPAQPKAPGVSAEQINAMVAGLAQKLAQHPEDVSGWEMLARSYFSLGRYAQASEAYAHLSGLHPDNADYLTSEAFSLALSRHSNLQGEPDQLLQRALQRDPNNLRALSLSGSAAFDRHDYSTAIAFWNRVLAQAPPDSEVAVTTRSSIKEAEAALQVTR